MELRKWLHSFVTDRSQYVAIGSDRSVTTALSTGIPQESIFGPLLFALYVSVIADVVHSHGLQYHLYVDDLMLYTALVLSMSDDFGFIVRRTNAVSSWFTQNALSLNPNKIKAAVFGTIQWLVGVDDSCGIDIADAYNCFSNSLSLLGVTFDATLSFDKHVSNVVQTCTFHNRALHPIRLLRQLRTVDIDS